MPPLTATVCKPKPAAFKSKVLEAVHTVLVASGALQTDKFQPVFELAPEDFHFAPIYPDPQSPRSQDFVLIEILWSVGLVDVDHRPQRQGQTQTADRADGRFRPEPGTRDGGFQGNGLGELGVWWGWGDPWVSRSGRTGQ